LVTTRLGCPLWNLFEVGMELKHTKLVKRKRNGDYKKFDVTKFSDEKKKKRVG